MIKNPQNKKKSFWTWKKLFYGGLVGGAFVAGYFVGLNAKEGECHKGFTCTNFSGQDLSTLNTTQLLNFNTSYAPNSTIQAATEPTESISESCSDALKRLCKDFMASDFDESNPTESTRKLVDLILYKINDCNDCKEIYDIRVIILNFPNVFMDALEDQLNKEDSSESSCDFWKAVVDISKYNEPKIREKLRQKNG